MVISKGLEILYSFLYWKYINHIHLNFVLLFNQILKYVIYQHISYAWKYASSLSD
jgi:hypothetical protein